MKLALILVALILVEMASAEIDHVEVNYFDIRFSPLRDINNVSIDPEDGLNGSVTIPTQDGSVKIDVTHFPEPTKIDPQWMGFIAAIEKMWGGKSRWVEFIEIDGTKGVLILPVSSKVESEGSYETYYYLESNPGEAKAFVRITSYLPFFMTADLLRSIHVFDRLIYLSEISNATGNDENPSFFGNLNLTDRQPIHEKLSANLS